MTQAAMPVTNIRLRHVVAASPQMKRVLALVDTLAPTKCTVLIQGETGTGKELIAQRINEKSNRASQPFVVVDFSSQNEELIRSELFGHERGAFTGAERQHAGLVEAANGGTLFIDEISKCSLTMQGHLLRFLENGTYRRVGSNNYAESTARIIVATNKNLKELVLKNSFRDDLFYRLHRTVITIPPLRERREDLGPLAKHFISISQFDPKPITDNAIRMLERYMWPGNARELRNVVETALIKTGDKIETIKFPDDSETLGLLPNAAFTSDASLKTLKEIVDETEKVYIEHVLREMRGKMKDVAKILGIDPATVHRRMRYFGLKRALFRK